ncbi:MAG: hypothetical protein DI598_03930 [Pseudopedobacter saltans]|uniref:DUF4328 domain-containing protein n=1 Tax=Pseudopedobacter saltans TaxID=151895 RepID=A0A2W5F8G7_9SPHI|nr:MAG: hypothetical protein DI598_03930 [Pseudopedobacter saltans]
MEIRPNNKRANQLIISISIVALLSLTSFFSKFLQYRLLVNIQEGDIYTDNQLTNSDLRENIILFAYIIAYVISVVMFIRWFRRAYYNLEQKESFLSYTNATAAWAWFVPIFNLYKPYQMMKEMFSKTELLLENNDIQPRKNLKTSILALWWVLWIVNGIADRLDYASSKNLETMDEFLSSSIVSMVHNFLRLPLAFVTILFITRYAANETLISQLPDKEELLNTSPAFHDAKEDIILIE